MVHGKWVKLSPEPVPLGTGQHLANLVLDEFMPVKPHLALELDLSIGGETPAARSARRARLDGSAIVERREVPPL